MNTTEDFDKIWNKIEMNSTFGQISKHFANKSGPSVQMLTTQCPRCSSKLCGIWVMIKPLRGLFWNDEDIGNYLGIKFRYDEYPIISIRHSGVIKLFYKDILLAEYPGLWAEDQSIKNFFLSNDTNSMVRGVDHAMVKSALQNTLLYYRDNGDSDFNAHGVYFLNE